MEKISPCGDGSGFPLCLFPCSFTICSTPYKHKCVECVVKLNISLLPAHQGGCILKEQKPDLLTEHFRYLRVMKITCVGGSAMLYLYQRSVIV